VKVKEVEAIQVDGGDPYPASTSTV